MNSTYYVFILPYGPVLSHKLSMPKENSPMSQKLRGESRTMTGCRAPFAGARR